MDSGYWPGGGVALRLAATLPFWIGATMLLEPRWSPRMIVTVPGSGRPSDVTAVKVASICWLRSARVGPVYTNTDPSASVARPMPGGSAIVGCAVAGRGVG